MEKLNYCLEMIECCWKDQKVIQDEIDLISKNLRNMANRIDDGKIAEVNRLRKAKDALYTDKETAETKLAMLENNAQVALYEYALPFVVQVIGKYSGKRIGTKTKEKMAEDLKSLSGCSMYLNGNNVNVYLLSKDGYSDYRLKTIEISFGGSLFDDDNKLLPVEISKATLNYFINRYIEDPDTEVKVLRDLSAKVIEASEILNKACDDYNAHIVGRIPRKTGKQFYRHLMV